MVKSYINDGIIGNGRMLGCLAKDGELHRLFWPNIDHMQHIDRFEVGIKLTDDRMVFLTDPVFEKKQEYLKGTNILKTAYHNETMGIRIVQSDFCLMDKDVMIRRYEIENLTDCNREIGWGLYSSSITSIPDYTGTLFDLEEEALIHYRRDQYMSVSSDLAVTSYQLAQGSREDLIEGRLSSLDNVLMVHEGALYWDLGKLEAGQVRCMTFQVCFAHSYKELKKRLSDIREADSAALYKDTEYYWKQYLSSCRQEFNKSDSCGQASSGMDFCEQASSNPTSCKMTPPEEFNNEQTSSKQDNEPASSGKSPGLTSSAGKVYDELYERTLLVLKLMYDKTTGGLLAAPEMDENMEKCGRYAYCWGRDAAFIADALDLCGLHREAEQFFYFAASTQEDNGSWFQRYCLDGNLAPAWGLQVDETGALLYGIWKHYQRTGDLKFLQKVWNNVSRGADFLAAFIDPETGLPKHSRDLWEERWGEHTYSAASVHAGLVAGVSIAECLGRTDGRTAGWEAAAKELKTAIEKVLWDEERQCFLRGVRTQLYPESRMDGQECMMVPFNSKGAWKKVVCRDRVTDISLIGLSVPFGVLSTKDPRMAATVKVIETALRSGKVGGIKRYEDDEYIGGNPWILTTLWLALYYIEDNEFEKALSCFDWAVKGRTELGLLPEQIDKDTGKPVWIVPLTWSHAMYALVYHALQEKKLI